jgi:ubiquinone/menaquinone biosynthesis C-methylase UbiE
MYSVADDILNLFCNEEKSDLEKIVEARTYVGRCVPSVLGRADSRVNDIFSILPEGFVVQEYLDVGSAEGKITSAMSEALVDSHIYACDIIDQPESKEFIFSKSTQDSLPYPDSKFDLITLVMSAHHFSNIYKMISEIRRVLKKSGIVVIREHDARTDTQKAFYDIVHAVYSCILGKEINPEEFLNLISKKEYSIYRSADEFTELFRKFGFELISSFHTGDMFDSFYSSFT